MSCMLNFSVGFEQLSAQEHCVLDTDAALARDATLAIGQLTETVSVSDNTLHVETVCQHAVGRSDQPAGGNMTAVPLDGRSFTDLLSLQAGVTPSTTIGSNMVQDVGATILYPSGTLNPGMVLRQRATGNLQLLRRERQ